MIFLSRRLVLLHVQKTGGNSISTVLLPFAEDRMTRRKHQDGVNRFGVKGEFTRRKHAWLRDYRASLGDGLDDFDVAISVRDPLERAVSMYYSPHRWFRREKGEWIAETPFWDLERFDALVREMPTLTDFLEVDGRVRQPDHLIRFESLPADLAALGRRYDLPVGEDRLPHANRSAAPTTLQVAARGDPEVVARVRERFAADYRLLGIDPP